ncbi:nuclear transport factor 2 family protein [Amphritea sp.]|uniref:nuclear transport factor 2 family protein n=1 Tax=Amphritea sp. TaxID=1872502 RepID=UPI003D102547
MKTQIMTAVQSLTTAGLLMALVAATPVAADNSGVETMSQKQKVVELLKSIETGASAPVGYINGDNYIQHNLAVADGLAAFAAVLQALPEGSARVNTVRVFEDGDFVFAQTDYNFFGPKVGFDIFRFENGLIVEHWDNLAQKAEPNSSGRTQLDGDNTINSDVDTEASKALVADFVETILIEGDMTKIGHFIGPAEGDYIQHNPAIGDGLKNLGAALGELARQGTPLRYSKNHKILGEHNFVLAVSEGEFLGEHVSFYDLFRVENGLIVEHWDTIETIPPESAWQNSNGKFGL